MADEQTQKVDTTVTTPIHAVNDDEMAIKANIEKMEAAVTDLEAKGADLFSEEIKNLEQKIENAEKELAAKTEETVTVAETEMTGWWDKHRTDIFNVAKIAALVYIAYRLTI